MEYEMRKLRTAMAAGIGGALLLCITDWLMIYGDTSFEGELAWLTAGVMDIEPWRNALAMALALPAVVIYAIALMGAGRMFSDEGDRRRYTILTVIGMLPWLCIHLFYVMILFAFTWLTSEGYQEAAYGVCEALFGQFIWLIPAGEALMVLPFIYIMVMTFRRRTVFTRKMTVNSPLVWFIVLKALTLMVPMSPAVLGFTNGLMSESMIVWFLIYVTALRKRA